MASFRNIVTGQVVFIKHSVCLYETRFCCSNMTEVYTNTYVTRVPLYIIIVFY